MTPCERTATAKTHQGRLVRESGGNGGDEAPALPNPPVSYPVHKKTILPLLRPIVQVLDKDKEMVW
jgi:hypothetical protein